MERVVQKIRLLTTIVKNIVLALKPTDNIIN